MQLRRHILTAAMVLMAMPLLSSLGSSAVRAKQDFVPQLPTSAKSCLLDRVTMRYHHMEHLRSLRDQVVRRNDRSALGPDGSLGMRSCSGCHTDRAAFCDRCHSQASVQLDCFNCHEY